MAGPTRCEGCGETRKTERYLCRFGVAEHADPMTGEVVEAEAGEWEACDYCAECADLARSNWSGETLAVVGPLRRFAVMGVEAEGWDTGETWNGWACPVFTREQAEALMEAWPGGALWERGAACFLVEGPESDVFEARADGLYPIGTAAWCWEVVS